MDRVLIVDDEPLVRIAMKTMVPWESLGFEVPSDSPDGQDAMGRLISESYSVLVTDIMMPVMNGVELIREAKKAFPKLVCVALSAYDDFRFVKEAFLLGLFDYVLKTEMESERLTDLFAKIRGILDRSRAELQETQSDSELLRTSKVLRKEEKLKELLWSRQISSEEWSGALQEMSLRLHGSRVAVLVAEVEDTANIHGRTGDRGPLSLARSLTDILDSVLGKNGNGEALLLGEKECAVLLSYDDSPLQSALDIRELCSRFTTMAGAYLGIRISFGISGLPLLGGISPGDRLAEARAALSRAVRTQEGQVVFHQEGSLEGSLSKQTKAFIHSHYQDSVTLVEAARKLNVSQEHLCRVFHQQEGKTFTGYLMEYRMEVAKSLLRKGDMQVIAVAERVGYASVTYFNSAFRRMTGMSPKEYRRNGMKKP